MNRRHEAEYGEIKIGELRKNCGLFYIRDLFIARAWIVYIYLAVGTWRASETTAITYVAPHHERLPIYWHTPCACCHSQILILYTYTKPVKTKSQPTTVVRNYVSRTNKLHSTLKPMSIILSSTLLRYQVKSQKIFPRYLHVIYSKKQL